MPQNPEQIKRDLAMETNTGSTASDSKSWFLGIGINQYLHFTPLNNAVKDVQDIVQLLQEQYDLSAENTLTLYNEAATRKNIIRKLDRLQKEVGPSDKLLIYYSGHGHLNKETGKGYWIPTDAERDSTSEYIRNSTIREYIETLKPLHTLLISDSCFSGSLFVRGASRSTAGVNELAAIPSRWAICSGRHDEEVFDGEPGKNSPFAESIMDTLRRNRKKEFNVAKLVDRVIDQTRSNYKQLPEGNPLYGVGHKGGQYIFRLRADEREDWAAAKAASSLPAFTQFLENHPKGQHAAEAQEKIAYLKEEAAWEKAQKTNTVLSYYGYDQAYPNGRYSRQALDAITGLEEEAAWKEAQHRNKLSSYRRYTKEYPKGKYLDEANASIKAIVDGKQEPASWKQATEGNTVEAFEKYLQQYPQSINASEAENRLDKLKQAVAKKQAEVAKQEEAARQKQAEETAWKEAQAANSVAALDKYLEQYPKGRFVAEAKRAKKQLQNVVRKEKPQIKPKEKPAPLKTAGAPAVIKDQKPVEQKPVPKWVFYAAGGLGLLLVIIWGVNSFNRYTYEGKTIRINDKTWMAENLNYKRAGSWCYDNDPANCQKYGRLYTWKAAQKACKALGNGWHLPTDKEWREMAKKYGGLFDYIPNNDNVSGQLAYKALVKGGSSNFSALLGGYKYGAGVTKFARLEEFGHYWSAREQNENTAWYYRFDGSSRNRILLEANNHSKLEGLSCRCIKDD